MADVVKKSPPPQATGKGAGTPLANMSLYDIRSQAAGQIDPMRGRFIDESDPRAQVLLTKNREHVRKLQGKAQRSLEPGHRVMHASRGKGVVKEHPDGNKIEVIFAGGKVSKVQIANLEKL